MNSHSGPSLGPSELGQLCRDLILQEDGQLRHTLATLHQLRQRIATGGLEGLDSTLQDALAANTSIQQLTRQRECFQQTMASVLKVAPHEITLRRIEHYLSPPDTSFVRQERERLRRLAQEVEQVAQGTALVVWWCLDLIGQVFCRLSGQPVRSRYSASGKVQRASCGPTWQGRG